MKQTLFMSLAYLQHWRKAGLHSPHHAPFVNALVSQVILNRDESPAYKQIRQLRSRLMQKTQVIESTDFGSGAGITDYKLSFVRVASIVKSSALSERCGMVLYRLVEYFKPATIIELGTSVGISTLYLAMANPASKVLTLEGCTTKSEQAAVNFEVMQVNNIIQHIGRFDIVLPEVIRETRQVDLVFIDGNHTYDATIANFNALLKIAHSDTIFVLDDIHWSAGMQKAWDEISDHELVTLSIDLFRMGIVFLSRKTIKQKLAFRI